VQALLIPGFGTGVGGLDQDGDTEGTLLFNPADVAQAGTAIKEAGIKYRRELSEAGRAARAAHLKRIRVNQAGQLSA
jgi:hypothetical protein